MIIPPAGLQPGLEILESGLARMASLKAILTLQTPGHREEALALPVCGAAGVWKEAGEAYFNRPGMVADLTASEAVTLHAFWNIEGSRWNTAAELSALGWDRAAATAIVGHLQVSLLPAIAAAIQSPKVLQKGDSDVDLLPRGEAGDMVYDSIYRVMSDPGDERTLLCEEFVLAEPEATAGKLQRWAATELTLEADLVAVPLPTLHYTQVYLKGSKGRWSNAASAPLPQLNKPAPSAEFWWITGRPLREDAVNLNGWTLCCKSVQIPLLQISSANWYWA